MAPISVLKKTFGDQAVGQAETLIGRAKLAKSPAEKYAREICAEIGLADPNNHIIMGPTKELSRILQKAASQCAGDVQSITDICRLAIVCDDIKTLDKARKLFFSKNNAEFHDRLQERSGIRFHSAPKDYLSVPKRSGYMAIYLRMEADIGQGRKIPFELQITHRGLWNHYYPQTHRLYESIRTEIEAVETKGGSIPRDLSQTAQDVMDQILSLHREGAEQHGVMPLVRCGSFPEHGKVIPPRADGKEIDIPPPANLNLDIG